MTPRQRTATAGVAVIAALWGALLLHPDHPARVPATAPPAPPADTSIVIPDALRHNSSDDANSITAGGGNGGATGQSRSGPDDAVSYDQFD